MSSSLSAQGVVERASAELTKRINGLGLSRNNNSSKQHHPNGKTSVMERVTNVFCGGSGSQNTNFSSVDLSMRTKSRVTSATLILNNNNVKHPTITKCNRRRNHLPPSCTHWDQLLMDERFLNIFFQYFTPCERCKLAQICTKWRDVLYSGVKYWNGLLPVLQCKEMRMFQLHQRTKMYSSLLRRGFHHLCLSGASDDDITDFCNTFPLASKHIHGISLKYSNSTDRGLEILMNHLQSLYELELAGCNEITEAGLWTCLNPRIVSLTLTDCINVADEAVGAVAQLLPGLYEFSLQAYHVTDTALGYFSTKQSNTLNVLKLHSCWEITNHGVVNIVHSLPNLTVLSLSGCSKITDDGVELIAENLQKLHVLDLSWCPRITDTALEYIACDLNQLEQLILDRCVNITDIGIGYVSTMLSLTVLYLRWCSQIRDLGLQHLCTMRNLQMLSLAGCPLLTSGSLSSLIQLRNLRELELTNCPGASMELFDYLKEHLPHCLVVE